MLGTRPRTRLVLASVMLYACGLTEPRSKPIHTDLSGTWPVTFHDLVLVTTSASCTLEGLTLIVQQDGGREQGNNWQAGFHGTYSGGTLTCPPASPESPAAGTLTGTLVNSNVTINLSSGAVLDGVIWRPSLNWSIVELRGETASSAHWVANTHESVAGRWNAGPITTKTRAP